MRKLKLLIAAACITVLPLLSGCSGPYEYQAVGYLRGGGDTNVYASRATNGAFNLVICGKTNSYALMVGSDQHIAVLCIPSMTDNGGVSLPIQVVSVRTLK